MRSSRAKAASLFRLPLLLTIVGVASAGDDAKGNLRRPLPDYDPTTGDASIDIRDMQSRLDSMESLYNREHDELSRVQDEREGLQKECDDLHKLLNVALGGIDERDGESGDGGLSETAGEDDVAAQSAPPAGEVVASSSSI